jgi:hypothetical protein
MEMVHRMVAINSLGDTPNLLGEAFILSGVSLVLPGIGTVQIPGWWGRGYYTALVQKYPFSSPL